jgi:hypothetical protein
VCASDAECCSGLCSNGTCDRACLPLADDCTSDADCCSGYCNPSTLKCEEDVSNCAGPWETCVDTDDCCLGLDCINGRCITI